jgi:hypothetical protein
LEKAMVLQITVLLVLIGKLQNLILATSCFHSVFVVLTKLDMMKLESIHFYKRSGDNMMKFAAIDLIFDVIMRRSGNLISVMR